VTVLLDANVLIALVMAEHVHHGAAERWLVGSDDHFASCPSTQGALLRMLIREGQPAVAVHAVLAGVMADDRHEFWADAVSYRDVPLTGVIGHRQVTDAYLAQLARIRQGRLVTFDQGLAALHRDVADLIPTAPPGTAPPQRRAPD
jgi:toxin-antitoxin system PIN domain toxin